MTPIQNWKPQGNPSALVAALEAAGFGVAFVADVPSSSNGDPAAVQAFIDAWVGPLEFNRKAKLEALALVYGGKFAAGRNYGGKNYQIDPASQSNIAAKATTAVAVLSNTPGADPWPQGFYWIASDNSHMPMDAAAMYAFAQDVGDYVTMLILTSRAFKDAIGAAADQKALDAIDITAGWPAN